MFEDIYSHRATQYNIETNCKTKLGNDTYQICVYVNSHRATQYNIETVKQNGEMILILNNYST